MFHPLATERKKREFPKPEEILAEEKTLFPGVIAPGPRGFPHND
jgi:hypothetical protein